LVEEKRRKKKRTRYGNRKTIKHLSRYYVSYPQSAEVQSAKTQERAQTPPHGD
jgi:hypothetical protein